ncbi:MAG TPA: ATP-binding protein, partial [Chloroflexia bacterium]|nr:ATP-binding protein [Chloroflexia bacterium]
PEVAFFRELVARWQALVTRLLTRAGQITIRERVSSPYLFTTPVRGAALVGREDVFDEIRRLWVRPGQRNSLLIHGHRRMGKTSVAQALGERCQLGADTRLLYRSMEGLHLERGQPGELYRALAFQFWLLVKDRLPRPDAAQLTGPAGRATFDEFLALFAEARGALRVVLVLDEFELLYHGLGTATANEVIKQLRDQTQTYPWLALALVGLSDLDDWRLSYHSPLLGWAPIAMDFLTPAQVANVLANPLRDADFPLDYSPDALSAIATQTHGQPYLVQIVGDLLVEHYNRLVFAEHQRHTDVFDAADVQAVLDDARFYETAAAYFEGVWGQAERGQAGETAVLTALAAQPAGLAEAALRAATGLADPAAFDKARDALARHKMILLVDGRWQHAVPLMARWVRHRPRPDAPAPGPDAGP